MKDSILGKVTVGFRCPMNWEAMTGNDRARFCSKCQKTVTDLSQLTREEAEAFVEKEGPLGKACIRIWRDENGKVVTQGCGSVAVNTKRVVKKAAVAAAAAGGLAMAACSSSKQNHEPLMGIMCPPSNEK